LSGSASSIEQGAVELSHVTKRFGDLVAVEDVTLGIEPGEFVSLLGPSGCGKTTTLRMLAGFEQPDQGAIRISGIEVAGVPAHRRDVNTVFQSYSLFPHLSVLDNVAFGPRSKGATKADARDRARRMLGVVHLEELAGRRPAQLSGGQQQRVALARALVNEPSALLLDEPLAALDLKLRQAMQLELKRIQREVGITFIFVTHDQEEALTMSDRIAVMSGGRIEQVGTPEEIYLEPETIFVAGFIGSANLLPARISAVDGVGVEATLPGGACVRAPRRGRTFATGAAATVMIRPERMHILDAEPAGAPAVRARVTDRVFRGSSSDVIVRTADGFELIADLEADDAFQVRPGEDVWVSWSPGSASILAEATTHAGANRTDVEHVEASL
jgi:spermidine/putrescine transport system ATP-binding protein